MTAEVNMFYKFKTEFVQPIKDLLDKYNVDYVYEEDYRQELGYYIRNGIVKN